MANDNIYISIHIIEAMVYNVEQEDSDTEYENATKAMSSSILNYYFPLVNGFLVTLTSEENKNNEEYDYGYGSRVFRFRRHLLNSIGFLDRTVTVVETKKQIDSGSLEAAFERLENALENSESTTRVGRYWALLIRGVEFMFYEYQQNRPGNHRLLPWGSPDQPERNVYHVRRDAETIDWMLRQMIQQDTPPIRP